MGKCKLIVTHDLGEFLWEIISGNLHEGANMAWVKTKVKTWQRDEWFWAIGKFVKVGTFTHNFVIKCCMKFSDYDEEIAMIIRYKINSKITTCKKVSNQTHITKKRYSYSIGKNSYIENGLGEPFRISVTWDYKSFRIRMMTCP